MDQVVAESLEVAAPAVGPRVGVPAGVLQGAVMGLPLVRVIGSVETMGVPEYEPVNSVPVIKLSVSDLYLHAMPKSTKNTFSFSSMPSSKFWA